MVDRKAATNCYNGEWDSLGRGLKGKLYFRFNYLFVTKVNINSEILLLKVVLFI
jgi:hypothetical protein